MLPVQEKFRLIAPERKSGTYVSWTALDYQQEYDTQTTMPIYWGLGTYELSKPVEDIETKDPGELEELTTKRSPGPRPEKTAK